MGNTVLSFSRNHKIYHCWWHSLTSISVLINIPFCVKWVLYWIWRDILRQPSHGSIGGIRGWIALAFIWSLFVSSICFQVFLKDVGLFQSLLCSNWFLRYEKSLSMNVLAANFLRWSMGRHFMAHTSADIIRCGKTQNICRPMIIYILNRHSIF